MKLIKYTSFFVYVSTISFLLFLFALTDKSIKYIESNYDISVSLTGDARSKVVADRILAIDGVKDVRIISASKVYEEFKRNEVFSKIKIEENPFTDRLRVILETLKIDVDSMARNIRQIAGVSDVAYDGTTISIYKKLKSVLAYITTVLIFLAAYTIGVCLFYTIRRKKEGLLKAKILFPDIYIFLSISAVCFFIAKFAYGNFYSVGYDYIINLSFLTASSILAALVYEK